MIVKRVQVEMGIYEGGEEEITYVTLSEGIVRNKNIYQPAVHEKGWSEEKLIKYVI